MSGRLIRITVAAALSVGLAGCAVSTTNDSTTSRATVASTVDDGGWSDTAFNGVVAYCQGSELTNCGSATISMRDDYGCDVETVYLIIDRLKDVKAMKVATEYDKALEEYNADGGCGNEYAVDAVAPPVAELTGAEAENLVERLAELPKRWNENQLRWVTAFSSDSVSYDDFVATQYQVEIDQGNLLAEFEAWQTDLPADIQNAVRPLLDHYGERYRILREELFPTAIGDDDASFQAAGDRYTTLTSVETLEPILRSIFELQAFADGLRSEGHDPEAVLDGILSAFGN